MAQACRTRRSPDRSPKKHRGVAGDAAGYRALLMATVAEVGPRLGIAPTCRALALPRATFYRRRRPQSAPRRRPPASRALSTAERAAVLGVLHEPHFVDLAPAEVYATLLDEGRYSLLGAHDVSPPRRTPRGARAPESTTASAVRGSRAVGPAAARAVE